ncbi:hypothetical protein BJX61DRAFT_106772 [Aspergillus egyptiacus]|nr:hypothetical protein BJX61DRAFT_106772 [Aspergillus egyptiacus]
MPPQLTPPVKTIQSVRLADSAPDSTWDISISYPPTSPNGIITSIAPSSTSHPSAQSPLILPPLTHPHIHLDKAFIHNTPSYSHLLPTTGTFREALTSTTQAKAQFNHADLLQRGEWLLAESVASGVTAMRAFVEVDHTVGHTSLDVGLTLKREWREACEIQLAVFAQDPVFSTDYGNENRRLIEDAIAAHGPEECAVLGTTPYVEDSIEAAKRNIEWAVGLALRMDRHLDFHLDYNLIPLNENSEPLIWHVLRTLCRSGWTKHTTNKRVMLDHCTRLSLFSPEDWVRLAAEIHQHDLPISFVGLPTSDLYMASTAPSGPAPGTKSNPRGTLHVPDIIRMHGLDAVMSVNNVGNAFTPWGSADPLSLACLGVGVYQAGTVGDAELLFECVSMRARNAIGLASPGSNSSVCLKCGDCADFLILFDVDDTGCLGEGFSRPRKSVAEVIWDPPVRTSRAVVNRGRMKMPALSVCSDHSFQFVDS